MIQERGQVRAPTTGPYSAKVGADTGFANHRSCGAGPGYRICPSRAMVQIRCIRSWRRTGSTAPDVVASPQQENSQEDW